MKKILISIIVVTKNSAATLRQTLESISQQSYKHIEVVAIDGVSEDATVEIFKEYSSLLGYIVSEPDKGVYDAMNKGIKAAHGDIIYFLNSNDTFYSNDVCQCVVDIFERNNIKIIFGDIYFKKNDNGAVIDKDIVPNSVLKNDRIKNVEKLYRFGICHQAIFYHRSIFENVGIYDLSYAIYGDFEFNLRAWLYAKDAIYYLNKIIANFELGGISTNVKYSQKRQDELQIIYQKYDMLQTKMKKYFLLGITFLTVKISYLNIIGYLFGILPIYKIKRKY